MTTTYHRAPRGTDPAIYAKQIMQQGDTMHSNRGWHALPNTTETDTDMPRRIGPCVTIRRANGDTVYVISPRGAR